MTMSGDRHNIHQSEHWLGMLLFFMIWAGITAFVWLVSITGAAQPQYAFPIQRALADFLTAVWGAILEFFRTIPYPR
jgi:hypothetical protein